MRRSSALTALAIAALALGPTGYGAAQTDPCGDSYTVRTGDTMGAISVRCATSVEALMRANPQISDPAHISIGQELAMPRAGGAADAVAAEWARQRDAAAVPLLAVGQYTVEADDDMASIATKLGVPLRHLLAANEGIDPFALQPGQVLALPDPGAVEASPDTAAGDTGAAGDEAAAAAGTEGSAPSNYTVEPGDSLAGIAAKAGVPLAALIAANEGVKPRALRPGQSLVLPEVTQDQEAADPAVSGAQSDTDAGAGAPMDGQAGAETVFATASGARAGTGGSGEPGRYTVEPGDSLAGIAAKAGVPLAALIAANEGVKPRALRPGQSLVLPDVPRDQEAPDSAASDAQDGAETGARTGGTAGETSGADAEMGESGSGPPRRYTVEPGDSLARIAVKTGVPLDALIATNERVKPRALRPGQSLVLPDIAQREDADPGESGADTAAEARAETGEPAGEQTDAGIEETPGAANDDSEIAITDDPAGAGTAGTSGEPGRYTVEPGDSLAGIATRMGVRLAELMAVNERVDPRALRPGQELVLPDGARDADVPGGAEDGSELAAAPGADGGPAAGGDAAPDGEASAPVEPVPAAEPERMRLEGRIRKGVECPVLKTPDGRTYSLVSQAYGFTPGDYVAIEAEPVEVSFCMQGQTVRVTSMKPRPAPQGG